MKPTTKKRIKHILNILDEVISIGVIVALVYEWFCNPEHK